MSYTINRYNGTTLIPGGLSDGTINISSTSLTLIGKDYAGYGAFLNENFIYLLENFAGTTSPSNPITGQLWWDTTNSILKVWSGSSWKISTGATAAPFSAPPGDLSALGGDLWFDTTNQQLKIYSGSAWVTVGPQATSLLQTTGPFSATITDTSSGVHKVIQIQFNGVTYAMFAYENFTTTIPGFTTIKAGLNFSTTVSPSWVVSNQDVNPTINTVVQRDGSGAIQATGVTAGTVNATTITASSVINGTFNGNLTASSASINTLSATTVTASQIIGTSALTGVLNTPAQTNITSVGTLTGLNVNGATTFSQPPTIGGYPVATVGGTTSFSSIDGTPIGATSANTGRFTTLTVTSSLVPAANLTIDIGANPGGWWNTVYANNVSVFNSITPAGNLTVNLGTPTRWFNNIYGRSVQALYADLAERFHADAVYAPGTVVEMGGPNEITKVVEECSERVFGVISTNAAYLMNSGAGTDATHPPVAMSGRVPVRAIGMISKGDRLVSAGNGLARTGLRTELTAFNVIGRALENKTDTNEGVIEAIVKLNS